METSDQRVARRIGDTVDTEIERLLGEKHILLEATARIAQIDEELAILQTEKTRIDSRRPPRPQNPGQGQGNPQNGGTRNPGD